MADEKPAALVDAPRPLTLADRLRTTAARWVIGRFLRLMPVGRSVTNNSTRAVVVVERSGRRLTINPGETSNLIEGAKR